VGENGGLEVGACQLVGFGLLHSVFYCITNYGGL